MTAAAAMSYFFPQQLQGPRDDARLWDRPDDGEPDATLEFASESAAEASRAVHAAPLSATLGDDQLAALIEGIAREDQRALEALYEATSSRVHGLVLRITQRRALAEEAVEDTFWQVWRQAPRYDAARGRPITWLLAMARTRAIDALRRDERFQHEEMPDEGILDEECSSAATQDLLAATRSSQAVHEALSTLDSRARQLVCLAFFRGLTHEEIAQQEALPLGTVKSLIRRSLQQLREALGARL